MSYLPAIFSLFVAAAGWFYIFYSSAATRLSGVEPSGSNVLRVRLRRVGGTAMILLAAVFYAMFVALRRDNAPRAAALLLAVVMLMIVIVVLGLVDLRLTNKIRRSQQRQDQ